MTQAAVPRPGEPRSRAVLCPYCGEVSKDAARCDSCRGNFDPLSRQATQNSMGPWFIRSPRAPYRPGCSFEVVRGLVEQGKVGLDTVLRGPTTNQFWSPARRTPGVANLLGFCHNCAGPAGPDDVACLTCGATFRYHIDRQHLGLTEVRLLPGQAPPEAIAASASARRTGDGGPSPALTSPPTSAPALAAGARVRSPLGVAAGERHRVPWWVFAIAGLAVAGAMAAAAWIMDVLPGVPSPILKGTGVENAAPGGFAEVVGSGGGVDGPPRDASPQESAAKKENAPEQPVSGAPDGSDAGAVTTERPESRADELAEARRLLRAGGMEDLRRVAGQTGTDGEAGALARAAERMLAQRPLRQLP